MYSHYLLVMGRIEESLVESQKTLELDPLSPTSIGHLAYHYLCARQYDKAIEQSQKSVPLAPSEADYRQFGDAYYQKGMFSEAVEEFLKGRMQGGATLEEIAALKEAFAKRGIKGYLQKRIEQLKAGPQPEQQAVNIAGFYARLSEKDQAFEWLEKAYAGRSDRLVHLREELAFDNLRPDPRFADLLRRIGLPPP
jgi:tetratricopeptide (TPR) repeat protein